MLATVGQGEFAKATGELWIDFWGQADFWPAGVALGPLVAGAPKRNKIFTSSLEVILYWKYSLFRAYSCITNFCHSLGNTWWMQTVQTKSGILEREVCTFIVDFFCHQHIPEAFIMIFLKSTCLIGIHIFAIFCL